MDVPAGVRGGDLGGRREGEPEDGSASRDDRAPATDVRLAGRAERREVGTPRGVGRGAKRGVHATGAGGAVNDGRFAIVEPARAGPPFSGRACTPFPPLRHAPVLCTTAPAKPRPVRQWTSAASVPAPSARPAPSS